MEVIGFLNQADFLVKDHDVIAVIGGGHYVLSLGDEVYLTQELEDGHYQVELNFSCQPEGRRCIDQMTLKFKGNEGDFKRYLDTTTVH
jgi:hypothetical protein